MAGAGGSRERRHAAALRNEECLISPLSVFQHSTLGTYVVERITTDALHYEMISPLLFFPTTRQLGSRPVSGKPVYFDFDLPEIVALGTLTPVDSGSSLWRTRSFSLHLSLLLCFRLLAPSPGSPVEDWQQGAIPPKRLASLFGAPVFRPSIWLVPSAWNPFLRRKK